MNLYYLLKGLLVGLAIAAPVGPIGVLCIQRSLNRGRLTGFVSGLGAATADALYGCVAALGLTVISGFIIGRQLELQVVGGAFLIFFGIRIIRSTPADKPAHVREGSLAGAYVSVFLLTLTNPMTILLFAGIFSALGLSEGSEDALSSTLLILGVFVGSALWWFLLSSAADFFRKKLNAGLLRWLNRLSGIIMLAFGAAVLLALFVK